MTSSFSSNAKCVLVIGATSGIGRDLALAIHGLPSKPTVIVAGRRQERLNEILTKGSKAGKENLHAVTLDVMSSADKLEQFVKDTVNNFPELDAVVFSSGIQHVFDFKNPETVSLDLLKDEFTTNYIAVVTMIKQFLPHFLKLSSEGRPSYLIPVTSGLASQPAASLPGYCATKAAVHSFCISLRSQLRSTKVQVVEVSPPLVESELHDHQGRTPALTKVWMTLAEFTPQVMQGLERGDDTIAIGSAAEWYAKHEKGKQEGADAMYSQRGV